MTQTMTKVFTLLSGGVDSSTTLAIARKDFPEAPIECVTFDYGQRHVREIEAAQKIALYYGAEHRTPSIAGFLEGMLVDKGIDNDVIPNVSYAELPQGISPTYVSFRNGTMLSLLAARAQAWVMQLEQATPRVFTGGHNSQTGEPYYEVPNVEAVLYCGVHADDGVNWAYPDCTPEFIGSMASAILVGTYNKVRLRAPLQYMNKTQVVQEGLVLAVPLEETWSCYKGEDKHCGTCPTCRSRKEAFHNLNAVRYDVEYAA